ncbi:hypothetical protein AB0G15_14865 [Streptosporangium sp. NPDC023825]|uniref:hypothetical protein n=1 Tax=Streptosporangium sp. NPDC023825 TaxID=3154909 RepID=UPI0034371333
MRIDETGASAGSGAETGSARSHAPDGESGVLHARDPGEEGEFLHGLRLGLDPQPAFAAADRGAATTNPSSWWNHLSCTTCGHTFRRGDRVLVDEETGTVRHAERALECGTGLPDDPGAVREDPKDPDNEVAEFSVGLLSAWPPAVPISRLAAGDWRIPRRGAAGKPRGCGFCGHTFRAGEYVVVCPCSPDAPRCEAAVHRDPAIGLPCWERWQPSGGLSVCPVTQTRIVRAGDR